MLRSLPKNLSCCGLKTVMTLAVVTVAISLAAAIPAAYAFSRMRFKGRKPILKQLVLLYSFPSVLSMFAIYTLLRRWD